MIKYCLGDTVNYVNVTLSDVIQKHFVCRVVVLHNNNFMNSLKA